MSTCFAASGSFEVCDVEASLAMVVPGHVDLTVSSWDQFPIGANVLNFLHVIVAFRPVEVFERILVKIVVCGAGDKSCAVANLVTLYACGHCTNLEAMRILVFKLRSSRETLESS